MKLNREYTDAHPDEPCVTCVHFIIQKSRCTYRSRKYYCVRDEDYARRKIQNK